MKEVSETLPKDYGDLRGEYDAIRGGVAVIDLSDAGKLQLSGKNSIQFLNGLISNDVKSLRAGEGVLAAFPTLQGKLLALCRVYNLGEYLLMELDAINREKIFKNLSRFVPAGEFFVTDVSDHFALFSLQGPRTPELIEALTGEPIEREAIQYRRTSNRWGASLRRVSQPMRRNRVRPLCPGRISSEDDRDSSRARRHIRRAPGGLWGVRNRAHRSRSPSRGRQRRRRLHHSRIRVGGRGQLHERVLPGSGNHRANPLARRAGEALARVAD